MARLHLLIVTALILVVTSFGSVVKRQVCGGDLVDLVEFICEDRGGVYNGAISDMAKRKDQNAKDG